MATYNLALPDRPATRQVRNRLKKMQFGDGYEQQLGDGINIQIESWPLMWTGRTKTEIEAIVSFLETNLTLWFYWTTPRGFQIKVKCDEWDPTYKHDADCDLSATFRQVYNV